MKKNEKEKRVVIGGFDVNESSKDVVWPIFLIFIGCIFLLNSLSMISWNIWGYLWKFWPLLLILGGVRMIIGSSRLGQIIIGLLAVLIFGGVFFFVYTLHSTEQRISFISEDFTQEFRKKYGDLFEDLGDSINKELSITKEEYDSVEAIYLNLDIAAIEFSILAETENDEYVNVNASYFENYGIPILEEEISNGELYMNLSSEFPSRGFRWNNDTPEYVVTLGDLETPTSIDIDLGAGKGSIDLQELSLGSLSVDIGAGDLDVTLTEDSIASDSINFDIGAGDVTLVIPENVSFVLTYTVGAGEIDLNGSSIVSFIGDGTYKSSNYGDVDEVLDIDVNVGAGAFHIETN